MIARTAIALALAAVPVAWTGVAALTPEPAAPPQERAWVQEDAEHEENENPELAAFMKDLGRTMRTLGRGLKEEGAMETGLAEVLRLERAFVVAKEELPTTITSIEDEARLAATKLEWRESMHEFFKGLLALEMAYARGEERAVMEQLRALDDLKKQGHDRFKP